MEKLKATVFVERGNDGKFSAIMDFHDLDFGLSGFGDTPKEAIKDFYECYQEQKQMSAKEGTQTPELDFDFQYDICSFLNDYSSMLSKSGLETITGINQKQLWHYSSGRRKPTVRTARKVQERIHSFARNLSQVHFID